MLLTCHVPADVAHGELSTLLHNTIRLVLRRQVRECSSHTGKLLTHTMPLQ